MRRVTALACTASTLVVGGLILAIGASTPNETSSVVFSADYPDYDTLEDVEAASSLVVEVSFTGESRTVIMEPEMPADPSDPRQNPELGVDPAALASQPKTPPIVTTVHKARVIKVIEGTARVGAVIEIQELGGTYDGIEYVPHDQDTKLDTRSSYLVFLALGSPGVPYQVVNPGQAAFPMTDGGEPMPLESNELDVTTAELREYVD